jgi:hypothetical protein
MILAEVKLSQEEVTDILNNTKKRFVYLSQIIINALAEHASQKRNNSCQHCWTIT